MRISAHSVVRCSIHIIIMFHIKCKIFHEKHFTATVDVIFCVSVVNPTLFVDDGTVRVIKLLHK